MGQGKSRVHPGDTENPASIITLHCHFLARKFDSVTLQRPPCRTPSVSNCTWWASDNYAIHSRDPDVLFKDTGRGRTRSRERGNSQHTARVRTGTKQNNATAQPSEVRLIALMNFIDAFGSSCPLSVSCLCSDIDLIVNTTLHARKSQKS